MSAHIQLQADQSPKAAAVSPASTAAKVRFAGVEWLRILAVLHVIWVHTQQGASTAGGPLALMAVAVAFAARARPGASAVTMIRRRANRLLVPWLFWSAVYAALKLLRAWRHDQPPAEVFEPWMFITGPALHLWFLPACFVFTAAVSVAAARRSGKPGPNGWLGFSIATAFAVLLAAWPAEMRLLHRPWPYWVMSLPAAAIGVVLYALPDERHRRLIGLATMALLASLTATVASAVGWPAMMPLYVVCPIAAALAWIYRSPASPAVRWAGDMILGVYCAHHFVAIVANWLVPVPYHPLHFALIVIGSFALVAVLKATRLKNFV